MQLLDLLTAPWAIDPERLREIQAIYLAHSRGEKADIAGIEARLGKVLANEQQAYEIRDGGVAVMNIEGVMAPKANMFMRISGGASTQMITQQIHSMREDPRVRSVLLAWDTPGGSVFGLPEAGQAIRALAAAKPTVSVSTGTVASAGYWLASAANALYASGETDQVGNIGVYARMAWDAATPNSMEFVRGKYKRSAINGQAPTAEYLAYFEGQLDYLYTLFTEQVAQNRGVDIDTVLTRMADGRVFLGQQAVDAGLADGIATVDALIEQLAAEPARFATRRAARFSPVASLVAPDPVTTPQGDSMSAQNAATVLTAAAVLASLTREEFQAGAPALFASLQAEFSAAGAKAERERIQQVESQSLPGHEKLIASMKFDGKSSGGDAAMAVMAAERQARLANATALANDAPAPVAQANTPAVPAPVVSTQTDASLPVEERCKAKWEADAGVRAEFGSLAAYTALIRAEEAGKVKVLGSRRAA